MYFDFELVSFYTREGETKAVPRPACQTSDIVKAVVAAMMIKHERLSLVARQKINERMKIKKRD